MNSLSGKFGQKIVTDKVVVCKTLPSDPEDSFMNKLNNVEVETIERGNNSSKIIGYTVKGTRKIEDLQPTQPIYLSMMILAHSRRWMSKVSVDLKSC
jgi:hypothetical protein